jgi:hypothetical protein
MILTGRLLLAWCSASVRMHALIIAYVTGRMWNEALRERAVGACGETLLGEVSLGEAGVSSP